MSEEIKAEWSDIVQDLHKAVPTELPRCYFSDITERTEKDYTLHVFTDASEKVYGACAYIVEPNQAMLVMSKNRIAPTKKITLPKLVLMGTLVGARLANHIIKSLGKMKVQFGPIVRKKFIQNLVAQIRKLVEYQNYERIILDQWTRMDYTTRTGMTYVGRKFTYLYITRRSSRRTGINYLFAFNHWHRT